MSSAKWEPSCHSLSVLIHGINPWRAGDRVISVQLGQYHCCRCPGSLRRQNISSHDIDYVEYVGPGLTWGRILSTCVISMWSNDIKWKCMFMFPLKILARKELTHCGPITVMPYGVIDPSQTLAWRLQTAIRWRQWLPSQSLIIRTEVPGGLWLATIDF